MSHSIVQFMRSISQFDMMALHNFSRAFLVREQCGNLPLCVSLPMSTLIKGGASFGKKHFRNLNYHVCPELDLTTGTREVLLEIANNPLTVRYYQEALLIALKLRIESNHARFSKQQNTLRSVRYRDHTCPEETTSV